MTDQDRGRIQHGAQRGAIDDLPEMNKRTKKSWLELDEEFRSMIDDLPETNERTKKSWVEILDEELGSIDYLYDSFRSNPLGINDEDDEPDTPNGSGWLTSSPLDYQSGRNGNGNEQCKPFETITYHRISRRVNSKKGLNG